MANDVAAWLPARTTYVLSMKSKVCAFILASFVFCAAPAAADCASPAGPGVNWRRCLMDGGDYRSVDLTGSILRDAVFNRARIDNALLVDADAYRAKFVSASADSVKFDRARLIEADFTRANLRGASFIGADLRGARLIDASMQGANLSGARISGADLRQTNFSGALWIDGAHLCGDNSIGQCN